jgi:UDP-N-acetylmuramate--alanine ligase
VILKNKKNIYMIGIGGISMSAIAEFLIKKNFSVSGSDNSYSETVKKLEKKNIKINIGHKSKNILSNIDLIIYSAAIKKDNPEIIRAKELNIKICDRADILGEIIDEYKNSIAISGCHGKTTLTAMISEILIYAKKDPTIFLGGQLLSNKINFILGKSDYIVVEACEFHDSFLKFKSSISIINNFDIDHIDYFKTRENLIKSFNKFAEQTKNKVIINAECCDLFKNINKKNKIVFDFNKNVRKIDFDDNQLATFDFICEKCEIKNIKLKIPGKYNVLNAIAAISTCLELNVDPLEIKYSLENFCGTARRFEFKGNFNSAKIFDDYAHHPSEIRETLNTVLKMNHNDIYCVFQPHTYSRTKILFNEFAKELTNKNIKTIILKIYAAREKNIFDIKEEDLVKKINNLGGNAIFIKEFNDVEKYLIKNIKQNDLIITMGAGLAYQIGENLLKNKIKLKNIKKNIF